ncbi:hypothetical protein AB0I81_11960 [Nonomuraea sp. NPDC050404]|uniref:hypothetical protein n=1 Tax=Nonomuraea sp. NPDC050404 TaxID=3155783 RepID=UPI0033E312DB
MNIKRTFAIVVTGTALAVGALASAASADRDMNHQSRHGNAGQHEGGVVPADDKDSK